MKMIRHNTAQLDQKIQELERRKTTDGRKKCTFYGKNNQMKEGELVFKTVKTHRARITESQLDILHWKVLEEEMNTIIEELNILDTLIFLISRLLNEEPSREKKNKKNGAASPRIENSIPLTGRHELENGDMATPSYDSRKKLYRSSGGRRSVQENRKTVKILVISVYTCCSENNIIILSWELEISKRYNSCQGHASKISFRSLEGFSVEEYNINAFMTWRCDPQMSFLVLN
ncbi:hypothetical protein CRE_24242 [Caenorhabditis remanei]|uniref:Uncharacterized protein n=1 Tax=Caenorhabditis remanei TaxID=31234 RepID=E3NFU0_CAERE|nr:hypothetical protein CRE_24242 [Caenorhabditis remanei]